ncbi:MAG: hypothetical protein APG12_00917 [Candidatus Methanofastidiosum methylothiophilum]|uniref:Uncharacterized protein n=1 Tax=Candidatus Methanofastidiosum methylothiophilum TaxID=1705564 RepID=A0A150IS71_9EURY|nr:MAG: hypothetical protein APG10_00731 [Candidatus Methanofastidiosum methylthiophilus]KYC47695.1 MAG: hypothetical protein APG11_00941 [Candidatus Methanofastidiosum methylthiophilus]KYC50299.1 MAG: hypothetical protein APG12_00917 [Candidatus Methanofastidiosum methylthiophilus]
MPKLSLGEVFSVSRQSIHFQILLPFLLPTIFYILATSYLFQYLGEGLLLFQTGGDVLAFVYRWAVFILIALLIYVILMIFAFNLSSILLRDFATIGKKNYMPSIKEAYSKIFKVLFVNIMAFVIFITGILFYAIHPLLILMGFFLAPFLAFVSPSIIIDNLPPFKAIKNSLILSLHYTIPSFILFIFSFIVLVAVPASISILLYYFSVDLLGTYIIYGIPIILMLFATYISILLTVAYLNYRGY